MRERGPLEDVIPHRVLQYVACVPHNRLVNQRTCDIFHVEVVGVPTSCVDAKEQSERAGHNDLIIIQLGNRNTQGLPGAGFCSIKCDALLRTIGFHGTESFLAVRWKVFLD